MVCCHCDPGGSVQYPAMLMRRLMARLAQRGDECGLEHAPLSLSSGMQDTSKRRVGRGEREGYGGPRGVTSLSLWARGEREG